MARLGVRARDLPGSELVALVYYLLVEGLKAGAGEDYPTQRNALEAALKDRPRAQLVEHRAPLPDKLRNMKRPAWWSDDDDPLEGYPGR